MSFVGLTKSVGKIQKSITYWLSMILILFFHSWKVDYNSFRQVNLFFYYFNEFYLFIFLYLGNIRKTIIVTSI
jgi:hypothetical protein